IGMGAQRYSNDAQKYIQAANHGVKASQLRHELDERDGQIRVLNQTVEGLQAEVKRLTELVLGNANLVSQQLAAGQQPRPLLPQGRQMAPVFDVQTAQINATHTTKEVEKAASKKRTRARIQA